MYVIEKKNVCLNFENEWSKWINNTFLIQFNVLTYFFKRKYKFVFHILKPNIFLILSMFCHTPVNVY